MHRRRGEDDLRHLESAVAEKRHQIDDHRNTPCGDDRVAFETVDAHQRQPLQFHRSVGEMAQQADVEFLEIQPGGEHCIGLALHDVGDLAPERGRRDQGDSQDNDHGYNRDLHDFFHFLSVLKTKTVVPASSNPILR